ncbi:MAG: hypothetical protein JWN31_128 [Frankiales bacterium]|nr:hypothetical protein [Frankiales bacterium]
MILAADETSAGSLALLIVLVLIAVTVLLIRNMRGRIERLPASFDQPATPDPEGTDGSASGPTAGA